MIRTDAIVLTSGSLSAGYSELRMAGLKMHKNNLFPKNKRLFMYLCNLSGLAPTGLAGIKTKAHAKEKVL
jgi:hypothetical protein